MCCSYYSTQLFRFGIFQLFENLQVAFLGCRSYNEYVYGAICLFSTSHNADYVLERKHDRMSQTIKKIWNGVTGVLIALVILLAIALVGVRLVGLDVYVVLSGSMEPAYKTGSVIYVIEVDTKELDVGDVITFRLNGDTTATHRIIEVTEINGETAYVTKGDANDVADGGTVLASQVIGTPVFTIPYLGYLVTYLHSASGRYATIMAGAILLLLMILPDVIFSDDKKKEKEPEERAL